MEELLKGANLSMDGIDLVSVIIKFIISAAAGTLIAYQGMRENSDNKKNGDIKIAKSKILICITGAMTMIIIGNSMAKAIGLFGIGSFIRFRTTIEDPVDAAVMFILIIVGMAIGQGMYLPGIILTAFFYFALFIMSKIKGFKKVIKIKQPEEKKVSAEPLQIAKEEETVNIAI